MDKRVAQECIDREMKTLRQLPYAKLAQFVKNPESKWTVGSDGKNYQVEITAVWAESTPNGNLRVIVAVDDGGWRAMLPLTDSFIVTPDGSSL